MKVLLAGGCGFLGSHLAEALIESKHEVTVIDNLSSGRLENLSSVMDKVTFIEQDLVDFSTEDSFDYVLNLASRASRKEWETYPVDVALSNSLGNYNLINVALKSSAKFLFTSTSEVYGNPDVFPTPESYVGKIDPLGSRSPYDESKRFGETLVKAYEHQEGLKAIILRIFNTYGPRMRAGEMYGRVIDRFLEQAMGGKDLTVYGNGEQTRSFTYVDDTVSAIMRLMERGRTGEVYNVGSDREISINELAKVVLDVTGSQSRTRYLPLPPDDPKRRSANIERILSLGWDPLIDLRTGIAKMFKHLSH